MLLATATVARAFDFSQATAGGQTLYYTVASGSNVTVVAPADNWEGYSAPAGRLAVPATVTHNGVTYNVTAVASNAFRGCEELTAVELPGSVTTVGLTAFYNCTALTSVRLNEGVYELGRMAFAFCSQLDTIELPSTLRKIGISAFHGTAYVNNQSNWSDSVLYIGPYVIMASSMVVGPVEVAEGTLGIGTGAFTYCHNMRQINLPASLLFVGNLALSDCESLDTLRVRATVPPTLSDDAFNGSPLPTTIVPCGTLAAYSAAPYWSLLDLVEDTCTQGIASVEPNNAVTVVTVDGGIEVLGAEGSPLTVYDISGRQVSHVPSATAAQRIALPARGIYVVMIAGTTPYKAVSGVK